MTKPSTLVSIRAYLSIAKALADSLPIGTYPTAPSLQRSIADAQKDVDRLLVREKPTH